MQGAFGAASWEERRGRVMGNKKKKIGLISLWVCTLAVILGLGALDALVPNTVGDTAALPALPCLSYATEEDSASSVKAKLFGVVTLKEIKLKNYKDVKLIPGGTPIGVRLIGDGVSVVGMGEVMTQGKSVCPAKEAGLAVRDVITKVNGVSVKSVSSLCAAIEAAGGKTVTLLCKREGKELSISLTPVLSDSDGKYKSGMWVKDASSGIGTLTFIDPQTGEFGALGHGIADKETGALSDGSRGIVTECTITGIVKGEKGKPGELRGYLGNRKTGALLKNTECGVFGVLSECEGEAIPIAPAGEVKAGKAVLRAALDGTVEDYEIEISHLGGSKTKCFTVTVTDSRLLEKTGGIVQGMSGSPIIQNGKLVGAVTHVTVANPTEGYGIFIENMLSAAQIPQARAS